jgi:hypothetical protein
MRACSLASVSARHPGAGATIQAIGIGRTGARTTGPIIRAGAGAGGATGIRTAAIGSPRGRHRNQSRETGRPVRAGRPPHYLFGRLAPAREDATHGGSRWTGAFRTQSRNARDVPSTLVIETTHPPSRSKLTRRDALNQVAGRFEIGEACAFARYPCAPPETSNAAQSGMLARSMIARITAAQMRTASSQTSPADLFSPRTVI